MNDVGACMDVVLAMPSLQELARRANCLGRTLSGEYSRLCLHFIGLCVHQAGDAYEALADEVGEEVARGRSSLVVKVARWAAHNMLFRCGASLSAPFVDWRLIGTHAEVMGDEFLRVRRGTYVVLSCVSFQRRVL